MHKARVLRDAFGETFAALFALNCCLGEFPLSAVANRSELKQKQLMLLYYKINPCSTLRQYISSSIVQNCIQSKAAMVNNIMMRGKQLLEPGGETE